MPASTNYLSELSRDDAARFVGLIAQGGSVSRHLDLLQWLQGDVQRYLPHQILLAGWGDFEQGAIQHDVLSPLPGVRSYAPGSECLPFLLGKFRDHWVAGHRAPRSLSFRDFDYLLGSSRLPGTFLGALGTMRSVTVHGLCDGRGRQECVYAVLSEGELPGAGPEAAIRLLVPCIDSALRQIAQLPQTQHLAPLPLPHAPPDDACGLSEREAQIMAWVAIGKTNSEIGTILHISGFTVKNHMQRIFQKLNVFNRVQAVSKVSRVTLNG